MLIKVLCVSVLVRLKIANGIEIWLSICVWLKVIEMIENPIRPSNRIDWLIKIFIFQCCDATTTNWLTSNGCLNGVTIRRQSNSVWISSQFFLLIFYGCASSVWIAGWIDETTMHLASKRISISFRRNDCRTRSIIDAFHPLLSLSRYLSLSICRFCLLVGTLHSSFISQIALKIVPHRVVVIGLLCCQKMLQRRAISFCGVK